MQCPQCQHENNATAKFCEDCGARIIRTCPACDHEVSPRAKFCETCGTTLAASMLAPTSLQSQQQPAAQVESPQPEPPAPDAERRQLTVMFCDLAESTKLSGQLDPEDMP